MPESRLRLCKILVLPIVAVLCLLLLAALVVYFTLWSGSNTNLIGTRANSTLRFVIAVTRHGNRSPLFTYPSDPYPVTDKNFWPYGPGQLTARGRMQMYNLGKQFRTLYNGYLDYIFRVVDFQAYSTPKDRTLMSAEAFLAGLFPPKDYQVWNDQLLWQPVPVFITSLDHTEYIGGNISKICPRFAKEMDDMKAKFFEENRANLTALFGFTRSHLGINLTHPFSLYDSLVCAEREGYILPSWTKEIYPEPLSGLMDKSDIYFTRGSLEVIRLLQGQLFQEMVGLLQAKVNGSLSPDRKMCLYSSHDMTIRTLSAILGFDLGIINTGSALVLELHRTINTTKHHIEVLYIDGDSAKLEPRVIPIPNCGSPCPLQDLLDLTAKYYNITDYDKECQSTL